QRVHHIMTFQSPADWFDRPMRWAQLTFTENDPAEADLDFWFRYFEKIHADGVVLSTGGYIAYHATQIPLQYRSRTLGDEDFFGDAVERARALGLAVIVRTDPHAVHQPVFDAHQDWIAVDAKGEPRPHWSMPGAWVTCALGPYNFEFMTQVNNEIMQLYHVEALFGNRWAGSGMCYCEHCQRNFREATGHELPRRRDPLEPAFRDYLLWREQRLFDLWQLWDAELRAINPHSHYIPNSGGGALSHLNMREVGRRADIMFADRQSRHGLLPPWAAGKNGKEYRAVLGSKPVGEIFSVGPEAKHRWKDSVQSEPELRVWVADSIANGMRPWFTKFAALIHDDRWLPVVEELYRRHYDDGDYLRNVESMARVAMVYSQRTASFYGGEEAYAKVEDHSLGYYQALVEARIPFDMVHDELLDAEHVDRYKTLILPNIAALTDKQCEQLRGFVARGGSIVATYETSLYDEWGRERGDFGLADLFGVHKDGAVEGPMKNAYLTLNHDAETLRAAQGDSRAHGQGDRKLDAQLLLTGLENAQRAIHGVYRIPVRATAPFPERPVTLVPAYPDLPMEEVYPREPKTDIPELYLREIEGGGRVAYFPWDIDRTYWEVLDADHGKLLANAVVWATNEEPVVTVEGQGVFDVTAWLQQDTMTVHLVNMTNPMMMRGPFRELIASGPQRVSIRLPYGNKARRVRLLHSGLEVPVQMVDERLVLTVPSVLDHEIVAVDLEAAGV
ncbi:MAG: alpha-amylase family protein, partial [Caldilineaceae bacterium]